MYVGVFANDDDWRARIVAAGDASGDHAWPWPLHRRYRRLLDSPLADLRNTSGGSFGYAIIAAALPRALRRRRCRGRTSTSTRLRSSTRTRDYLGTGASGAGVRLLVELADEFAAAT